MWLIWKAYVSKFENKTLQINSNEGKIFLHPYMKINRWEQTVGSLRQKDASFFINYY